MASFLDLFGVVDSDGVNAARYRLNFLGSSLSKQDSWIFGMITELVYVFFQILVIPANAFLGRALDSGSWLGPLSDAYQRFTAPLYAVVPPWAIACLGLARLARTPREEEAERELDDFGSPGDDEDHDDESEDEDDH